MAWTTDIASLDLTPTKARHTYVADHIPAGWDEHIIERASTPAAVFPATHSPAAVFPVPHSPAPVFPATHSPAAVFPAPHTPAAITHNANTHTIHEDAEVQLATDAFASSGLETPTLLGMEWKGVATLYVRAKDQKLLDERRRAEERRAKARERKNNQRQRMAAIAVRVLEEACGGDGEGHGGEKRRRREKAGRVFLQLDWSGKPEAVYE